MMRRTRLVAVLGLAAIAAGIAALMLAPRPARELMRCLWRITAVLDPPLTAARVALSGRITVTEAVGTFRSLGGGQLEFSVQPPASVRAVVRHPTVHLITGRQGDEIWVHSPDARFAVVGRPGLPKFPGLSPEPDTTRLGPIRAPWSRATIVGLACALRVTERSPETVAGSPCRVLEARPRKLFAQVLSLPPLHARLWIRTADHLPARLELASATDRLTVECTDWRITGEPREPTTQTLAVPAGHRVETVPLGHLRRAILAMRSAARGNASPPGSPGGQRRLIATSGDGRLELHDGTRVLFLRGSPEAMGRQHGELLRRSVREVASRLLYGVGVGASFSKGRWFFDEIAEAWTALQPHLNPRHVREMDALADGAGLDRWEVRLANVFPELFHCSGFALMGRATEGGRIYHGRVLDYLRGVGLEANAVVIVHRPDQGHAWVNVGYAGFIGSVTAMNEQHISIGEMGGRGEGRWYGRPMAQLVRDVMETASSLEEAVAVLRQARRTCEYYYVIADGRRRTAVAIWATPDRFETVGPGEPHPKLPRPVPDAVLLSAGERYDALVERVLVAFGHFDAERARELMRRPVAMNSNIQSVLFAPDTLDFWVANADGARIASDTRYTRYNLRELLQTMPAR
ncbi:MAG: C45 family autoproteolytic acyltransferase/hydrolase [Kiritimatiellae bacterium]|nr:C45 family autoproteolytic acyltransferase/hydrolase [Kiritimatiellia bacterium]